MKNYIHHCFFWLILLNSNIGISQSEEAQQLLLNVEKLAQLKQILSNMKKGYEIISKGYEKVKDISKGNFNLHKEFLDALLKVSPSIKNYRKAFLVITTQQALIKESSKAFSRFTTSNLFNPGELQYIRQVNTNLLNQSLKNLEEFAMVITSGNLRMDDGERLAAIDRIYDNMQEKLTFLRGFINKAKLLGAGRKQQKYEIDHSRKQFGIIP